MLIKISGRVICWGTRPSVDLRKCIQKFSDWPPGARIANGTTLCH
jgi:hypothetical protein